MIMKLDGSDTFILPDIARSAFENTFVLGSSFGNCELAIFWMATGLAIIISALMSGI